MDSPLDLFLSYNSTDRPVVSEIKKILEARGITTFLDRDQLKPGIPWPVALEEGLRSVRAVAVFIGQELGGWQKREMWFALDRQVREEKRGHSFPVIPVLLVGADLSPGFHFLNTWIDLSNGLDSVESAGRLDALERAITEGVQIADAASERAEAACPYRGLEAFREEDAAFFAGRAAFSKQLIDFTLAKDLVAVVGPSGSGKSSVVQAGLVPLLRRELPPRTTWDVLSFTPGSNPFYRLSAALITLLEPDLSEIDRLSQAHKLGEALARDEIELGFIIDRVIEKSKGTGRLLLIADQFEELFTVAPEPHRRPFARALLRALGKAPFTLLVTLRADFYSQIIALDRELSDRLASAQVTIGALTSDELRDSIAFPARLVGLEFEAGLLHRILSDAGKEPGSLPLIEFALMQLWARRRGRALTNTDYDAIGGVTGALAQRAEAEFARFSQEEQTAARGLFSRLVRVARPEEGTEDTRQRLDLNAMDDVTERIVQKLVRPEVRLLVIGGRQVKDQGQARLRTVEIAHEALILNWERLRNWLNEDREFLLWRQRTLLPVQQWEQHDRGVNYLLHDAPLSEAEQWLVRRPEDLATPEQQFVISSLALREKETNAQSNRAKRLRRFSQALALLLVLALFAAALAFWQRAGARVRELISASMASQAEFPELSIVIGADSVAAAHLPWAHALLLDAEQQLHRAILASRCVITLTGHRYLVVSVAWSPDGRRLATASEDKTAKLWDPATGKLFLTLKHSDGVSSVAWRPDGKRLATASDDKTAIIWDAETGRELLKLGGSGGKLSSVAWRHDGKRLATASDDKTAIIWDAETGRKLLTLTGHAGSVSSVAWSPDGKRLATASDDKMAIIWDAEAGRELLTLTGHTGAVTSVAWSPDGNQLATGSADKTAGIWDASNGQEVMMLTGHGSYVSSIAWSPDGKRLATGGADKTAKIWDASRGQELLTLTGHTIEVYSVAWRPDGKQLATGSWDFTAKVWNTGTDTELVSLIGHSDSVSSVIWSPDGMRLATGSPDKTAKIWDAGTGRELLTLTGHTGAVTGVAWSPDGRRLATASADNTAKIWNVETGEELLTLRGHGGKVSSVAWSPDGRRLATASEDKSAKIWDALTGLALQSLSNHIESVSSVTWSPNGRLLATQTEFGGVQIWDAERAIDLRQLGNSGYSFGSVVTWSPDGKRIALACLYGAKLWDAATGEKLSTLTGHSSIVFSAAWSPDSRRLATGGADETAKVWDVQTGRELLSLPNRVGSVSSVAWSPDGRLLAAAGDDSIVQVYYVDIEDLMALARRRVTAKPPTEGCMKYLHADKCPPELSSVWH